MIIDAHNQLVGRMATYVAKAALNGEKIEIVNCEKAVMSGSKESLIEKYTQRTKRGEPFHGPFYPRREDMLVRRIIRGMLPWKINKGKQAYKNVVCYLGIPDHLKEKKYSKFKEADVTRLRKIGYVRVSEISKHIGRKP